MSLQNCACGLILCSVVISHQLTSQVAGGCGQHESSRESIESGPFNGNSVLQCANQEDISNLSCQKSEKGAFMENSLRNPSSATHSVVFYTQPGGEDRYHDSPDLSSFTLHKNY